MQNGTLQLQRTARTRADRDRVETRNDSDDAQPMPTVSYEQYRTLFHKRGLACATCMSLQNELKSGTRAADRERAKTALQLHHHEARLAYKMRRFDCQLTRTRRATAILLTCKQSFANSRGLTSQIERCRLSEMTLPSCFDVCQVNANFAFFT